MLSRIAYRSRSLLAQQQKRLTNRTMASPAGPNPLEADAGPLSTRIHHTMTMALAVLSPVFFMVPDRYSEGLFNKTFGLLLTANITAHSWIGLNYCATDYVPKISKALLGPSRYVVAAFAAVTFLGMSKIVLFAPGGLTGAVKGLWNPHPKDDKPRF